MALLAGALLLAGLASAQPERIPARRGSDQPLVAIDAVAQAMGFSLGSGPGSLTVRSPAGLLTLFADSPDVVWAPDGGPAEEIAAVRPVLVDAGRWFVGGDLLALIGVELDADAVRLPDGRRLALELPPEPQVRAGDAAEVIDVGNGVPGLRFYAAGSSGPRTVSLLLVDLGLLALAYPDNRAELDGFMADQTTDRPLYLVVTALAPEGWRADLSFRQGATAIEVRHPFRVRLLEGEPDRVAPDAPVVAVVLLPESFDLRRPVEVGWQGASGTVTFRR